MAGFSSPYLTLEQRLSELQEYLIKIKKRVREKDLKLATLSKELADLHLEFTEAKEVGDDFIEDTETIFKDQAITNGDFGNILCTLEIKFKNMAQAQALPKSEDEEDD